MECEEQSTVQIAVAYIKLVVILNYNCSLILIKDVILSASNGLRQKWFQCVTGAEFLLVLPSRLTVAGPRDNYCDIYRFPYKTSRFIYTSGKRKKRNK